jgi:hypothetical protein
MEEVEEANRQNDLRHDEVARIAAELSVSLSSLRAKHYYKGMMELSFGEQDCLKLLELYGQKAPRAEQLPSSYDLADSECKRRAVLLGQRVRRSIGEGYCSKWNFPREWPEEGQIRVHMVLTDDVIWELQEKLSDGANKGSALEQLFS